MKKNSINMKATKKNIQEGAKKINKTLMEASEEIIEVTVETGEQWQKLISKAVKNSQPLLKKQSEIMVDTMEGMKKEAQYGVKRFEKLTGFDFGKMEKTIKSSVPKPPTWAKEQFEKVADRAEDILGEVSKRGDEIAESVADTAKSFVKEAKATAEKYDLIPDFLEAKPKASKSPAKAKKAVKVKETTKKVVAKKKAVVKKVTVKTAPKAKITPKAELKPMAKAKQSPVVKSSMKTTPSTKVASNVKSTTPGSAIEVTAKATPLVSSPMTKKPTVTKTTSQDLKVIEGIGPKLEQLLNEAGYTNYTEVANAKSADLQKVLDKAGTRYRMHNPKSWPAQAKMAEAGKIEELKKWQADNNAQKM